MTEDQHLREYLLGRLPPAGRDDIEERIFADPALFALAEAMEAEVMDEYTAGSLDADDRRNWEAYLASHPRSHQRLVLARTLHRRFSPGSRNRWWMAALAAAAMLCLVVYLTTRPRPQIAQTPAKTEPVVVAVTLAPGGVRSASERPQVVHIPPDASIVRIRWNAGGANVRIRHIDTGRIVWTGPVTIDIPAVVLSPGDYVGTTLDGRGEESADYSFRVERR